MTEIKNTVISLSEEKLRYDNAMKLMLSDVRILSRILHAFVPEYKDCSIKDIEEKYIEKSSVLVSKAGVSDLGGERRANILSNEDKGFNETDIYYDILFKATYPDGSGREIGMYINIESQSAYHPGYPLEMRAVYYGARLLSSQLKAVNRNTDYGCLKKVYSIWLCTGDVPLREAGSISLYEISRNDIIKTKKAKTKNICPVLRNECYYDLISIIMVRLSEDVETSDDTMELLRKLISGKVKREEKLRAIRESGIEDDEETEGGIINMFNHSEYIWQSGIKEGLREGENKGIAKGEDRLNSLYICLMNDGKIEEMKKVMHDRDYRQKLYKIYGL